MLAQPWKSGPSGPRNPHQINAGFSPRGRLFSPRVFQSKVTFVTTYRVPST